MATLQIHKSMTDLTELYFSRTARRLHSLGSSDGLVPPTPLSRTERARFQRAFLRYQLYTRIFPYDQAQGRKLNEFLVSLMNDVLVDAEEQLVEMFLTCPGGWRPPTTAPPSRPVNHSVEKRDLPPSKCVRLTASSGMERYESMVSIKDPDLVGFYKIPWSKGYEGVMKRNTAYLAHTLGLTALSTLVLHHGSGTDQRRILRGAGLEPGVSDYLEAD